MSSTDPPPPDEESQRPSLAGASWHLRRCYPGQAADKTTWDQVAIEAPLGLRVQGKDFAVLMRTPGRDEDLVAGFLAAEGLLAGPEDLAAMAPCAVASGETVLNVALAPGVARGAARPPRLVSSSCGLCGSQSVELLRRQAPRALAEPPRRLSLAALEQAFGALRRGQALFAATAGSHGAALAALPGAEEATDGSLPLLDLAEDVGRHNAVDKLMGRRLREGDYPLTAPTALLLSGRLSFELVQKAVLGGLALVAGVGMPSTMAIAAAEATGRSLIAWVRDGGAAVYAGPTELV